MLENVSLNNDIIFLSRSQKERKFPKMLNYSLKKKHVEVKLLKVFFFFNIPNWVTLQFTSF